VRVVANTQVAPDELGKHREFDRRAGPKQLGIFAKNPLHMSESGRIMHSTIEYRRWNPVTNTGVTLTSHQRPLDAFLAPIGQPGSLMT